MAGVNTGSILDLKELALETGATITSPDGKRFNTGGVTAKRSPLPKPATAAPVAAPVPAPTPPVPVPDMSDILKQLIAMMNRPVEVKLPPMPAPQVVVKEAQVQPVVAPRSWTFEFERNSNGTIKSITAKAGK